MGFWHEAGGREVWRRLLAEPEDEVLMKTLRRATYSGQPLGDEESTNEVRATRTATASQHTKANATTGSDHPLTVADY